jgi:tetratricopeptide (TPR) repeat protein
MGPVLVEVRPVADEHYSTCRIRCLTHPQVVSRNGDEVILRPKESTVLWTLVFCLLDADAVPSDVLHELVWPNTEVGRQVISQLTNLRRKLPGDIPPDHQRQAAYRLTIDRFDVDVWRFYDLACEALRSDDPAVLDQALRIWPVGSSITLTLDHPAIGQLQVLRNRVLGGWARHLIDAGQPEQALDLFDELMRRVPEREDLWIEYVHATALTHGPAAAHRLWQQASVRLRELDLPVGPEFATLPRSLAGRSTQPPPPESSGGPASRRSDQSEVVRVAEIHRVLRRLKEHQVAVLHGAPGNGKTHLGARVAERLQLSAFRITFRPGSTDTLDTLLGELARHFGQKGRASLAKLLQHEAHTREQFSMAYKAEVLNQTLSMTPTLLIIDDVHVIESSSDITSFLRDLLARMENEGSPSRVLLISRSAPTALVDECFPGTVYGISKIQSAELLKNLGVRLTDRQLDSLYSWTAGNVKLIRMLAAWLQDSGANEAEISRVFQAPQQWGEGRRYLLKHFVGSLPRDIQRLLLALSMIRTPIPLVGLWAAARAAALDPVSAVTLLTTRHVVEESVDGRGFYLHSLVRDFARDLVGAQDLAMMHEIAAYAQEAVGDSVEHSFHLGAAGDFAGALRVVRTAMDRIIQAGDTARLLDVVDSWPTEVTAQAADVALLRARLLLLTGHLDRSVQAFAQATRTADDPATVAAARLGSATALRALARWPEAAEELGLILRDPAAIAEPYIRAIAQAVQGAVHAQLGDLDGGRNECLTGIGQLRALTTSTIGRELTLPSAPVAISSALVDLGWLELMAGRLDEAVVVLAEAASIQGESNDDWGRCTALSWLGRCYWQAARWHEADRVQLAALDLARRLGNLRQEALSVRHIGLLAWNRGADEVAERSTKHALELCKRIGDRYGEAACLDNLGALMFDQGHFATAIRYVRQAQELCLSIGANDFRAYAVLYEAKIHIRSGAAGLGLKLSVEALRLLRAWNYSPFYTGMALRAIGEALIKHHRLSEAIATLQLASYQYYLLGSGYQYYKCLFWLSAAAVEDGRRRDALRLMEACRDKFSAYGARRDAYRAEALIGAWSS